MASPSSVIKFPNNVAVTPAASSCELEAKYSFYFNEVHRR